MELSQLRALIAIAELGNFGKAGVRLHLSPPAVFEQVRRLESEVAEKLYMDLRTKFMCEYDPKQAIGKRYARMDEIGTPYCVTIDGQTLTDQTVTIRERDTLKQDRVALDKVGGYLSERLSV